MSLAKLITKNSMLYFLSLVFYLVYFIYGFLFVFLLSPAWFIRSANFESLSLVMTFFYGFKLLLALIFIIVLFVSTFRWVFRRQCKRENKYTLTLILSSLFPIVMTFSYGWMSGGSILVNFFIYLLFMLPLWLSMGVNGMCTAPNYHRVVLPN